MTNRLLRLALILLDAFLALTAIAGGIGLLTGVNTPTLEWLARSPFRSFTIPGLALLLIVGGTALVATIMMIRRHPSATIASGLAGAFIIGFEIVEVIFIGSPAGIARTLQVFYLTLGLLIVVLAATLWARMRREAMQA